VNNNNNNNKLQVAVVIMHVHKYEVRIKKFKSEGLHKILAVATWSLGNHLSIRF
jgi:hypothetical protein